MAVAGQHSKTGRVADVPSPQARAVADHAVSRYVDAVISTLADLVAFRTVAEPAVQNAEHPEFQRMKAYLARRSNDLELDFEDHGAAVVIGLGLSNERLGLITHGDVQPADRSQWAGDPFRLDTRSEPGRLVGRGVEDDKGSIATALYAMKALQDHGTLRRRRVELVISLTEESDWDPFREFLSRWSPPALNVALDAEYPVVTAEKGSGTIVLTLPPDPRASGDPHVPGDAHVAAISGGAFRSQIPGEAEAVIERAGPSLAAELREGIDPGWNVAFDFAIDGDTLRVQAHGVAAHSSTPWEGRNAITHLAALLGTREWPRTQAARMVRLINELVGTGDYGERFGNLAFAHRFMGPLTLSLTTLGPRDGGSLVAGINIRRPVGQRREEVETAISAALDGWKRRTGSAQLDYTFDIGDPYYLETAPHIPVLLRIFRFYCGQPEAVPVSVGGGTQARLVPNGVNFGPSMPGAIYTGHSEHEFMTVDQLRLNLTMYAAMLAELSAG